MRINLKDIKSNNYIRLETELVHSGMFKLTASIKSGGEWIEHWGYWFVDSTGEVRWGHSDRKLQFLLNHLGE